LVIAKALKCNDIYGVDISPEAVRLAREKGVKAYQLDVEENDLQFNDMFFDVVYCGELIEHVFNPDKVIRDIYRVLKNGGLAIITTPNLACWYNRIAMLLGYQPFHYSATIENYDVGCFPLLRKGSVSGRAHIRTMTYKAFKELLRRHGFKIVSMKGAGTATGTHTLDQLNRLISRFPSLASYLIALVEKP